MRSLLVWLIHRLDCDHDPGSVTIFAELAGTGVWRIPEARFFDGGFEDVLEIGAFSASEIYRRSDGPWLVMSACASCRERILAGMQGSDLRCPRVLGLEALGFNGLGSSLVKKCRLGGHGRGLGSVGSIAIGLLKVSYQAHC